MLQNIFLMELNIDGEKLKFHYFVISNEFTKAKVKLYKFRYQQLKKVKKFSSHGDANESVGWETFSNKGIEIPE